MNISDRINALKNNEPVRVVSAPQLFPTPSAICEKMVDFIRYEVGDKILEPSAGTGNILKALENRYYIPMGDLVAIEIDHRLVDDLNHSYPQVMTTQLDFLEWHSFDLFDCIIMNPPFKNGEDIKHILHAKEMLAEGGALVAICANGPRQRDQLMDLCEHWEDLPAGSFKSEGTNVNTALIVIKRKNC